jgi:hypothetical protein
MTEPPRSLDVSKYLLYFLARYSRLVVRVSSVPSSRYVWYAANIEWFSSNMRSQWRRKYLLADFFER